jgi:transcriptional regulator with XRE-family HTH domain
VPTSTSDITVGPQLRSWRQRRHLSQLDLANLSGVTTRHLSFVETGRSRPSREMVLHLAEHLEVPLRDRNQLLVAAGYAPTFRQGDLADPSFDAVRTALDQVLAGHEPYPAIIVDRRWDLVSFNEAAAVLVEGVAEHLLEPPANVLRASLHPDGLAPRIRNLDHWSEHILGRLRRQALITGDEELVALGVELTGYVEAAGVATAHPGQEAPDEVATPMVLESRLGPLAMITTIATFGTALDITLAELALEAFLPADAATTEILNAYARERRAAS